jgi:hypothetical protein
MGGSNEPKLDPRVAGLLQAFDLSVVSTGGRRQFAADIKTLLDAGVTTDYIQQIALLGQELAGRSSKIYDHPATPQKLHEFCRHFDIDPVDSLAASDTIMELYRGFRSYSRHMGDRALIKASETFDGFSESLLRLLTDLGNRHEPKVNICSPELVKQWLKGNINPEVLAKRSEQQGTVAEEAAPAAEAETPVAGPEAAPAEHQEVAATGTTALALTAEAKDVPEATLAVLGMERGEFAALANRLDAPADEETAHSIVYLGEVHGVSNDALVRLVDGGRGIPFADIPLVFKVVTALSDHTGINITLRDKVDLSNLPEEVGDHFETSAHVIDTEVLAAFLRHFGIYEDGVPGLEDELAQQILELHELLGRKRAGPMVGETLELGRSRSNLNDTLAEAVRVAKGQEIFMLDDMIQHLKPEQVKQPSMG